jgi:hypothetical protein
MKPVMLFLILIAIGIVASKDNEFTPGKHFDRFMIIMFENHGYEEVIKDPHFSAFAALGSRLTNYYAVTHPSQPNYISQLAGSFFGISNDSNVDLPDSNLVDLMEPKSVSWKSYQEDYPGNCYTENNNGKYYRKHNPFMSFDNIRENKKRCAKIVPSTQFDLDLHSGSLPNFIYFTPNIRNDGHNTNIQFAGKWLFGFLKDRIHQLPPKTIVMITWDEDDHTEDNRIYAVLIGDGIKPGSTNSTAYSHYSVTRTLEENWDLGTLGRNDAKANPMF